MGSALLAVSPAVEPSEGCGQDVGCNLGWGVLKKGGRPGRAQSSWLREDPFRDLLLLEEQLQQGRSSPVPGDGAGGAPGEGALLSAEEGGGGRQGGTGAGREWGGWMSAGLVVPASGPLSVRYAVSWALQEHSASLFLLLLGRAAHGCSDGYISPLALPFHVEHPLNSIDGLRTVIVSLLTPGKPSRTCRSGLVVLQTWLDSPSARAPLSPSRLVLASLSVSCCI